MALPGIGLEQWRSESQGFNFKGHEVRYWTAGSDDAPALILIHGFPTASWDWHYLWRPLAEHYRLIACDMLGFGYSAKPAGHPYSLLEQADLQQALLAHLGVSGDVHVLAHDYGDSVAQELLARHHEGRFNLASCVFLNGGLFPETHHPVLLQKLLLSPLGPFISRLFSRKKLEASFAKIFGPATLPNAAELDDFWTLISYNNGPAIMHRLIRYMPERRQQRERWVAAMQATQVPMRIIDGAVDPISGRHMVERYRELITPADTVILEGIGHYPQTEAPEAVLTHYLAFRQASTAAVDSP
ncbi:alpha/beta fold hydrolase [Pseudomonas sp. NPDC078700]|uniref:alpha/beta fold hydrolase n=1 Tax=Pseudomonas sp. NPDC078700 TaxID=3364424 RepID=UPI0037C832EB